MAQQLNKMQVALTKQAQIAAILGAPATSESDDDFCEPVYAKGNERGATAWHIAIARMIAAPTTTSNRFLLNAVGCGNWEHMEKILYSLGMPHRFTSKREHFYWSSLRCVCGHSFPDFSGLDPLVGHCRHCTGERVEPSRANWFLVYGVQNLMHYMTAKNQKIIDVELQNIYSQRETHDVSQAAVPS